LYGSIADFPLLCSIRLLPASVLQTPDYKWAAEPTIEPAEKKRGSDYRTNRGPRAWRSPTIFQHIEKKQAWQTARKEQPDRRPSGEAAADLFVCREAADCLLRKCEPAVDANFKNAAA